MDGAGLPATTIVLNYAGDSALIYAGKGLRERKTRVEGQLRSKVMIRADEESLLGHVASVGCRQQHAAGLAVGKIAVHQRAGEPSSDSRVAVSGGKGAERAAGIPGGRNDAAVCSSFWRNPS